MSAQVWTPERVARLRQGYASGIVRKQLAVQIGVSLSSLCGKAQKLRLVHPQTVRVRHACATCGAVVERGRKYPQRRRYYCCVGCYDLDRRAAARGGA